LGIAIETRGQEISCRSRINIAAQHRLAADGGRRDHELPRLKPNVRQHDERH